MTRESPLVIFGDSTSGNCHKIKFVCDVLQLPYEWEEVSVTQGDTKKPEFLALNPFGQVPVVRLPDGRCLAQSNAIMTFLAEGTVLIPSSRFSRAKMFEWMFWEQYSHEPAVAVLRFRRYYLKQSASEVDPQLVTRSHKALAYLNAQLEGRRFLVDDRLSLADIALVAYTRLHDDAGLSLDEYPHIAAWIRECETVLNSGVGS